MLSPAKYFCWRATFGPWAAVWSRCLRKLESCGRFWWFIQHFMSQSLKNGGTLSFHYINRISIYILCGCTELKSDSIWTLLSSCFYDNILLSEAHVCLWNHCQSVDQHIIISHLSHFQSKITNIYFLRFLQCQDMQFFVIWSVLYHNKLNIFVCWTVGQKEKQDI